MSATAYDMPVSPAAASPAAPGPEESRPRPVWSEEVEALSLDADAAFGEALVTSRSDCVSEPSAPPAVSLTVDEQANFIAQDVVGAVYGVGRTPAEAMDDFRSALDEELAFLRSNQQQLSPKLLRRLAQLERLFPDR